jgi:hypothetical protein
MSTRDEAKTKARSLVVRYRSRVDLKTLQSQLIRAGHTHGLGRPDFILVLALALLATAPAWIVQHPPLQDMPFHLATIRLVHNIHDAAYGFDEHFTLALGRTQYLAYYVLGDLLAYLMGIKAANIALMCVYLGGTPLALRSFLVASGRDPRLALFAVPVTANVMFQFGLLPFLLGIPIMFWALAAAAAHFTAPTRASAIALALLSHLSVHFVRAGPLGAVPVANPGCTEARCERRSTARARVFRWRALDAVYRGRQTGTRAVGAK